MWKAKCSSHLFTNKVICLQSLFTAFQILMQVNSFWFFPVFGIQSKKIFHLQYKLFFDDFFHFLSIFFLFFQFFFFQFITFFSELSVFIHFERDLMRKLKESLKKTEKNPIKWEKINLNTWHVLFSKNLTHFSMSREVKILWDCQTVKLFIECRMSSVVKRVWCMGL